MDYGCVIGDRVKIHCNCYVAQFTEIEEDAFLAPGVTIANDLFPGSGIGEGDVRARGSSRARRSGRTSRSCRTCDREGAMIGAGAVVTKRHPRGMLAYGCPAVPVRRVDG